MRTAAIMLIFAALVTIPIQQTRAQDAADAAADQAADQAAAAAADQAASSAADQAAASAADEAASSAADEAAASAAEQAGSSATDQAASSASDQAAASAADDSAAQASDTAESSAKPDSSGDATSTETAASGSDASDGERDNGGAIERIETGTDIDGSEIRANEIVVLADEKDAATIRGSGLDVLADTPLGGLGGTLLRIRTADPAKVRETLASITKMAPEAIVTTNHVYREADRRDVPSQVLPTGFRDRATSYLGTIGIIDTDVDAAYPGLATAIVAKQSFAAGAAFDAAHGTAVADMLERERMRVFAANVFASDSKGSGAATTDAIVRGLDWLVSRGVTVINMSIEGSADRAVGDAIRRAQAKGCIIVAAAGNEGPAAPPAYPAAFPDVIAVTAIDRSGQIYRYANQGSYISFAALGVDVDTAALPNGMKKSSGTSFAAPVVAGLIARMGYGAKAQSTQAVIAVLEKLARHLGAPGRNTVFGYGALDANAVPSKIAREGAR